MKTPKEQITELMMGKTIKEIERNNTIVEQALLIKKLERKLADAREGWMLSNEQTERAWKQRDTLAEALTELLDALGATHKPYELIGYGIAEHRAQEITALATAKGGER
jgi:predicted RNase H-like HicB family nuclease